MLSGDDEPSKLTFKFYAMTPKEIEKVKERGGGARYWRGSIRPESLYYDRRYGEVEPCQYLE